MNLFEIQAIFTQAGFYIGPIDGKWNQQLESAVRKAVPNSIKPGPKVSLLTAAQQYIMREIGGLAIGVIDGIHGPRTEAGLARWDAGNWRDVLDAHFRADKRMPAAVQNTWPLESKLREFYGEPGEGLVLLDLPYQLRLSYDTATVVSRARVHKKVADSMGRVLDGVLAAYGAEDIRRLGLDLWGGCFNIRPKRGGTSLSTHAWGIANDFDPARNQLRWGRDKAEFAKPAYEAWWAAWSAEGWVSLGKARNYDWMHVQAARIG